MQTDVKNLDLRVSSPYESRLVMSYLITNLKKVKTGSGDRLSGDLRVTYGETEVNYSRVPFSYFLTKCIEANAEKYVGKVFTFYNTSRNYFDCPLTLKEFPDGTFKLYDVREKGWHKVSVPVPGGGFEERLAMKMRAKDSFLRYFRVISKRD